MHIFGASSFAASIQSLPGGVFHRRHHLTALPGLHLNHLSAKFLNSFKKTLQLQLHQLLRLPQTATPPPSGLQVIVSHDVNTNSLTPPPPPTFPTITTPYLHKHALSALLRDVVAIVYCQRTGSPHVLHLLR